MSNGTHALQLLAPEPAPVAADKPATEVEVEIGKAAAAAVMAIAMGIYDYAQHGALTPTSRAWAGGMLGRVAELHLAHLGEGDFGAIVRREGKRAMQARPDAVLLARLGSPGQVDAVIDELICHVITISSKVVRDELARQAN